MIPYSFTAPVRRFEGEQLSHCSISASHRGPASYPTCLKLLDTFWILVIMSVTLHHCAPHQCTDSSRSDTCFLAIHLQMQQLWIVVGMRCRAHGCASTQVGSSANGATAGRRRGCRRVRFTPGTSHADQVLCYSPIQLVLYTLMFSHLCPPHPMRYEPGCHSQFLS